MEITIEKAIALINEISSEQKENFPKFLPHCYAVGDMASKIANKLDLDEEKAIVMGYLHDIGKIHSTGKGHAIDGYNYLKSIGVGEDIASVCITHSFIGGHINLVAGGIEKSKAIKKYLKTFEYTIYHEIINICDLMNAYHLMTVEERLIDIMERKGVYKNTQPHIIATKKLKSKFDELCACDIYELAKNT